VGRRGDRGRGGFSLAVEAEKRGGSGRRFGEIELTGGPSLSAGERERGGRGSRLAGGPRARKREGARGGGVLSLKAEKKGREGEKDFSFFNKFSMHFRLGLLIKLTFVFKTLIT